MTGTSGCAIPEPPGSGCARLGTTSETEHHELPTSLF